MTAGDARLLALAGEFTTIYAESQIAWAKATAAHAALNADPARPKLSAGQAAWDAYAEEHYGYISLHTVAKGLTARAAALAQAMFTMPATTPRGVLAKARIVGHAYGSGPDMGDNDAELHAYQDDGSNWLASLIADLERLAA